MKVFWSWQSDTHGKTGRFLVRDVLEASIKELKDSLEIEEPNRQDVFSELHLDQDRKDIPGSPDLARVILEKIDQSVAFIADVTPVGTIAGQTPDARPKKLINSNVAIELGYALHALTDRALIMVLNEHYGDRSDLPFDLRAKAGPIIYNLSPDADSAAIKVAANLLKVQLKEAIALCVKKRVIASHADIAFPAMVPPNPDDPARFREASRPIGFPSFPDFDGVPATGLYFAEGAAMWLRLMPITDPGRRWSISELRKQVPGGASGLSLFSGITVAPSLHAEDGFGQYLAATEGVGRVASLVFAFETGEIWGFERRFLENDRRVVPFVEDMYSQRLQDYAKYLAILGLKPPYRWICGISGARGYQLRIPLRPGHILITGEPIFTSNCLEKSGQYDGEQTPESSLMPFFVSIFNAAGIDRPEHLPR
jgi:hypothetical protein